MFRDPMAPAEIHGDRKQQIRAEQANEEVTALKHRLELGKPLSTHKLVNHRLI